MNRNWIVVSDPKSNGAVDLTTRRIDLGYFYFWKVTHQLHLRVRESIGQSLPADAGQCAASTGPSSHKRKEPRAPLLFTHLSPSFREINGPFSIV